MFIFQPTGQPMMPGMDPLRQGKILSDKLIFNILNEKI